MAWTHGMAPISRAHVVEVEGAAGEGDGRSHVVHVHGAAAAAHVRIVFTVVVAIVGIVTCHARATGET